MTGAGISGSSSGGGAAIDSIDHISTGITAFLHWARSDSKHSAYTYFGVYNISIFLCQSDFTASERWVLPFFVAI
jgi:hypothetical protein